MNIKNGKAQMDAMLRHLGSGHDLRDFPGTVTEKLALVWTAGARGLIEWDRCRSRYELTPIGWSKLTQGRRFGLSSLMMSAAIGITVAGLVLGVMWLSTDASDRFAKRWPTAPASNVQHAVLRPVDADATPSRLTANVVHEIPSPISLEPPSGVVVGDPTEPGGAEKPVVEEPKIEPAPTAPKETEIKKARRKKFSHRRKHHAIRRYAYQ